MPTVANIAQIAFKAVQSAIPDAVHDATISGAGVGKVVQEQSSGPSSFPAKSVSDLVKTIHCQGFAPSVGNTVTYANSDHLVFWSEATLSASGLAKAKVLPTSKWLSKTVTFQRKGRVSNGSGGFTEAWSAIAGAPTSAHVYFMSGNEQFIRGRVEAMGDIKVIVPHFAGLAEKDRIMIDGRAHNIRFMDNWEKSDVWLIVDAEVGAGT